jgi:hypothetical protein
MPCRELGKFGYTSIDVVPFSQDNIYKKLLLSTKKYRTFK